MAGESDIAYDYTGWECGVCGAYVMHGAYHACGGYPVSSPTAPAFVPTPMNRDDEIVDLLKRIVELLKKE